MVEGNFKDLKISRCNFPNLLIFFLKIRCFHEFCLSGTETLLHKLCILRIRSFMQHGGEKFPHFYLQHGKMKIELLRVAIDVLRFENVHIFDMQDCISK